MTSGTDITVRTMLALVSSVTAMPINWTPLDIGGDSSQEGIISTSAAGS